MSARFSAPVVSAIVVLMMVVSTFGLLGVVGLEAGQPSHGPAAIATPSALTAPSLSSASTSPASALTSASTAPAPVSSIAANALAVSKADGVSPRDVFVPRPGVTPEQKAAATQAGHVVPLYQSTPAPIGLAEYGLEANASGGVQPFILNTTSVMATFDPSSIDGPNATYLTSSSPDGYGVQLNAVATNITLFGQSGYSFWTQNVVEYFPVLGAIYLISNIWNFSDPSGFLSSNVFYSHGANGTQVGNEYYYALVGPIALSYPFDLTFYLNLTTIGGRDAVSFTVGIENITTTTWYPYDTDVFNSTAPGSTPDLTVPSNYTANGFDYNPLGLTNDFEITMGGPGGGSQVDLLTANATMTLDYWNDAASAYTTVPSAYSYGGETGETSTGASMTWSTNPGTGAPGGQMSTGPAFLGGLWNASTPGGSERVQFVVNPSNAFIFIGYATSSPFNISEPEWAVNVATSTFLLAPGNYSYVVVLSDYQEAIGTFTVGSAPIAPIDVSLAYDPALGIYTPLQAWENSQLPAISTAGLGTQLEPYIIVNTQVGLIDSVFGQVNDYAYPVFPGVFLKGTTAYVEFADPAPMTVDTSDYANLPSTNALPYWFYDVSNVAILHATNISGWFSAYASDFPYELTFNVIVWNSTNLLIADNAFNTEAQGLLLYGGGNTTVWGNTFQQIPTPDASYPLVQPYQGISFAEQESGDTIYNNNFAPNLATVSDAPITAVALDYDLYYGGYKSVTDTWNISVQSAANIHFDANFPMFPLTGSIIGTSWQGGNFWWDYGTLANPFGVLPYDSFGNIETGGDYAPLLAFSLYTVNVVETGLPAGTIWGATIVDSAGNFLDLNITNDSSYSVSLPNGTYTALAATLENGWYVGPVAFTVDGDTLTVTIAFVPAYPVVFVSLGLPASEVWFTYVTGFGYNASIGGQSITYWLPAGVYYAVITSGNASYAPSPPAYYISVTSSGQTLTENFVTSYPGTVVSAGLPPGTSWWVNATLTAVGAHATSGSTTPLWNYTFGSQSSTLTYSLPNGTYSYTIQSSDPSLAPSTPSGTTEVTGAPAVFPNPTFGSPQTVAFDESGLPAGILWSVTLNGTTQSSTGSAIDFSVPNGLYVYTVSSNSGYTPSPPFGTVTVLDSSQTVQITFTPPTFSVSFNETGLPIGAIWSVTLNGVTQSSGTSSIVFTGVANGSYAFSAGGVAGYVASPSSGSVVVSGNTFTSISFSLVTYAVTFVESALPSGTSWTVTFNAQARSSTTTTIVFDVANGTYAYSVGSLAGWTPTPSGGTPVVNGTNVNIPIIFSQVVYTVTFQESGLGLGGTWYVTLNGVQQSSTATTITFSEPNGTYAYNTSSSGYNANTSKGTVHVNGANPAVTAVGFSATSSGSSGLSTLDWIIIAVVIIIIIVIVVALAMRGRGAAKP